jgi:hypothetical protein
MPNMQGLGGGGHGHLIRADARNTYSTKKSPARGAGCGAGQPSHDMPVYAGEATPARALKCVQSGIFLPRFAIFRAVPISFGLAQQARLQLRRCALPGLQWIDAR